MNNTHPMLKRLVLIIILPLLIVISYLYLHVLKSLPETTGSTELNGIEKPVSLSRDSHGIVHIKAKTDEDAFFALGYAHAQDRLWQLEVQKRTTQGRLSEIFGKESVNMDIWFRTLGLHRRAASSWEVLSPDAQSSLTAYTKGINAWLDSKPVLPLEFILLNIQPEYWHVNDSLAYIKLFALNLSGNFRREISRMLASQVLDESQLATIFDTYPADAPTTVAKLPVRALPELSDEQRLKFADLLALQQSIESELKIGGRFVGSNGWVVSGQHSQNGQAILANDPHLGLQMPSQWYAASIQAEQLNVSGMTLVGLPLVIFGRNQHIAWGGTAMMTDNQDLYFERVNANDSSLYFADGQWQPFSVRDEVISVRADFPSFLRKPLKPIKVQVRSTRHGPVISDRFDVFEHPVALRWTALTEQDTSYEAFFGLNYATNWATFKQALSHQVAPSLNVLYADNDGNIGYVGAGQIPIRNKGNGELPVPGWEEQYHWSGFVPPSQWPSVFNPSEGYIVSANNKVVSDEYPYFISQDWAPPARAARITQLLEHKRSTKTLTTDDMQDIQADTLSLPAQQLLPLLTAVKPLDARQQQAIDMLSNWDGNMRRESPAAALFTTWSRQLRQALFNDELAGKWGKIAEQGFLLGLSGQVTADNVANLLINAKQNGVSGWCDNISTTSVESCDTILLQSLDEALTQLTKLVGSDLDDWEWGELHYTTYDHQPFSNLKLLDSIYERKVSNGGGGNTVNVSGAQFDESVGYQQTFGAVFRQIITMGHNIDANQTSAHLMMNSTGQSGNVLSEHYSDMVIPFRDVNFVSMDSVEQQTTVLLLPGNSTAKSTVENTTKSKDNSQP